MAKAPSGPAAAVCSVMVAAAWPGELDITSKRAVHPPSARQCVEPFAWVQNDRSQGLHAEAARRRELHAFWAHAGKFRLPATVPRAARRGH